MKRKAQLRWLPFVARKKRIDLDWFYVVSFCDSEITLQGHYKSERVKLVENEFISPARIDNNGHIVINVKNLRFIFT